MDVAQIFLSIDLRHFLFENWDLRLLLVGFRTDDEIYVLAALDPGMFLIAWSR